MLPVVKRKTLEIPHGLAAVAAAVCLGLAFVSDFQAREQALNAEAGAPLAVEVMVKVPEEANSDRRSSPDAPRPGGRERSEGFTTGLLPLLPGFRNGG